MAKENEKPKKDNVYKSVNAKDFAASYTDIVPYYTELSEGNAVKVDLKNKHVVSWLSNKIIVKEQ